MCTGLEGRFSRAFSEVHRPRAQKKGVNQLHNSVLCLMGNCCRIKQSGARCYKRERERQRQDLPEIMAGRPPPLAWMVFSELPIDDENCLRCRRLRFRSSAEVFRMAKHTDIFTAAILSPPRTRKSLIYLKVTGKIFTYCPPPIRKGKEREPKSSEAIKHGGSHSMVV